MQILPFNMPPFKSLAWVSDEAAATWSKAFRRINRASVETVVVGLSQGIWAERRLRVPGHLYLHILASIKEMPITIEATHVGNADIKGPVFYDVLLYNNKIQTNTNPKAIPSCCKNNHNFAQKQHRKEFLWEAAIATSESVLQENTITIDTPSVVTSFWQQLLVNPISYTTCSLNCTESLQLQNRQIEYMNIYGFLEEAAWLAEIYTWPIEWSAAHGICELRTPIIKIAYDTDATAETHRIQINGTTYPKEGAPGLKFPYQRRKFLRISDSKAFKAGLTHCSK